MSGIGTKKNGDPGLATAPDRLVVILLGPPGSGKGTQARMLSAALGIPSLSTGDLFRAGIASGTKLGREVENIVKRGGLVPDNLVNAMVACRLRELDCSAGCILDGYPRSVEQAKFLKALEAMIGFRSPIVLDLKVEVQVLMARLTARQYCPQCGRTYSSRLTPSISAGLCDDGCSPLVHRTDDQEAVIRDRMDHYGRLSGPLRDFYRDRRYYQIAATGSPEMVFLHAMKVIVTERGLQTARTRKTASVISDRE